MKIVNDIKSLEDVALHTTLLTATPKEGELFLCSMGNFFLAVGQNADKLYMKYGWDLSEFHTSDGKNVVYIVVTDDGYRFLKVMGLKVNVWNSEYSYAVDDKDSVSFVQQFIDLLRSTLPIGVKFEYPLFRQTVTLELVDYLRTARMTSLVVTSTSAGVMLDNSDYLNIVDKTEWDFKKEALTVDASLLSVIKSQREYILSFAEDHQKALNQQNATNGIIYNMYINAKKLYKGTIVLIKEHGNFVTFGDDAIMLAVNIPVTIYNCNIEGKAGHIAVVIDSKEFYQLTEKDFNLHVVNDNSKKAYQFGLTESFLSGKIPVGIDLMKNEGEYSEATIFKRSNGDYAVRATLAGRKLPEIGIPMIIGVYYQKLANSLEKRAWLYAVVHSAYGQYQPSQHQ